MNQGNRILYILIGILTGVVLVLGGLFYYTNSRLQKLASDYDTMKSTMEDTLALKEEVEDADTEDVEAAYVDPDATAEATKTPEATKKAKKATETPGPEEESGIDAETEFDDYQSQLQDVIAAAQGAAGGKWSVYVEDLNTNGDLLEGGGRMQAASLIKLYIMGAVYENYDTVAANAAEDLGTLLTNMITVSDNDAANALVAALGGGDSAQGMNVVNSFCTQYDYNDTSMGRLLLEENPSGDNYTSVEDCGKFLRNVYDGKFQHAEEMLELLKGQERRNKIPAGIPEGITVANKTGELDDVENDVAIVYGEKMTYIVCVMTEELSDTGTAVSGISAISNTIYGFTNQIME